MTDPLGELKASLRRGAAPPDASSIKLPEEPSFVYAVGRFFTSWAQAGSFGPDQAVLLRQALRWAPSSSLLVGIMPPADPDFSRCLLNAGIDWSPMGQLSVKPFAPSWLDESFPCDVKPEKRALDERFLAEAFLESVGYDKWRSPAQKEAAWVTLQAPPGSTRVIVLPTGSGKSLCFQLLPRFSSGLTVVIVPTIALAMDQQMSAARLFDKLPGINPVFFAADDDAEAAIQAVKEKRTRLLFTSPESCVAGRLRPILDGFAKDGWLSNLVVDEAHLIETWGAQFRVEFQFLSDARRIWRISSGDKLRTFLFSATMTPGCRETLRKMFSDDADAASEFVCQRLRPEIRYYSHQFASASERDGAVRSALWHLPRPAILYVTKQDDAEKFVANMLAEGFKRVDCFHGDTRRGDRRRILQSWKQNELDLIVATSAFGVGVDKSDVRAVVHACWPENLDRYYQEVGRGGRDGWSSVSLLLTAPADRKVAEGITVNLMTPDMIQERWSAMFAQAESLGPLQYALPVASRRGELLGTRTYGENIRWNKRLLLQLRRAGKLELIGLEFRDPASPEDDPEEWAIVNHLKFSPATPILAQLIEKERNEEVAYFRGGLAKLDEFLTGGICSGLAIGRLYGMKGHQHLCPGCPRCRREQPIPLDCEPLDFPEARPVLLKSSSVWVEGLPSFTAISARASFVDAISNCVTSDKKRLRHFYCGPEHFPSVLDYFGEAFPSNTLELHRLDQVDLNTKLSTAAALPLVFLHLGNVNADAIKLGRLFPSVHLFSGANPVGGRDIVVNEGFHRWNFEAWIKASPEESLPCLPITQ